MADSGRHEMASVRFRLGHSTASTGPWTWGSYGAPLDIDPDDWVKVELESTAGVATINVTIPRADEVSMAAGVPAITIDQVTRTAVFQAGSDVLTYCVEVTGNPSAGTAIPAQALAVSVPTIAGYRLIALDETTESDPTYKWLAKINNVIRGGSSGISSHPDLTDRDEADAHPGESITLDDAAFAGHLVGVTDVQTMAGIVDALVEGGTIDAEDVTVDDTDLTGPLAGVTDAQTMAAVVDGMREGWVAVTGFTAAPASVSTITMTTDHTSWVHKGDAIKLFVSVPVVSKNNVIVN